MKYFSDSSRKFLEVVLFRVCPEVRRGGGRGRRGLPRVVLASQSVPAPGPERRSAARPVVSPNGHAQPAPAAGAHGGPFALAQRRSVSAPDGPALAGALSAPFAAPVEATVTAAVTGEAFDQV